MPWVGQRVYLHPGITGVAYFGAPQPLKQFWWQHVYTCGHSPAINNELEETRQIANCNRGVSIPPSAAPCDTHIDTTAIQGVQWCPTCNGPEAIQTRYSTDPQDPVNYAFGGSAAWYEWLTTVTLENQYKLGANQDYVWGTSHALVSGNNEISSIVETPPVVQPRHMTLILTIPVGFGNAWYNQPDCGKFGFTTEMYADGTLRTGEVQYGEMKYLNVAKQRFLIRAQ